MKILACVPVFNEEKVIKKLIHKISKYVDSVLVCNDGSTDNTIKEVESTNAILINHIKNKGKGAALNSLFNYAKNSDFDVIVTIDGDGQFLPHEIPKLIKPILDGKSDIVIGYRFDDTTEMPSYRKIGNKFLDKMTNLASELPFKDTQSGFRAYSKKAIALINFNTNGFGADSEILVNASKKGLTILEEKVTVIYDTGYKTSTKNPLLHTGEVITSLLEFIALKRPLLYVGLPGIIILFIGIAFSFMVLNTFNETRYFSVPLTLFSLGSFIIGVILLLMSVVLFGISKINSD